MAKRKSFLLRVDPALHEALRRWADDELRSLNGQVEYLLREALRRAGRKVGRAPDDGEAGPDPENDPEGEGEGPPATAVRPSRDRSRG